MSRIQLDSVTRRFGPVAAVDAVSLDIADGEFLVLLGPSGCGKSTLLRMVAGLIEPSAGRILVDDRDVTHTPAGDRNLAMVFQSYALYPHLTVERNIGFPLRAQHLSRAEIRRQVDEVVRVLDLAGLLRRKPRELSGGQRQRVALGRALVRHPGAFLLDEPLSNLDAKLRTATRAGLAALHRRLEATFVYVTHDQVEAMTLATRIAVLNEGRLEQVGTPAEVYDRPASAFVAGFLGSPGMNLVPARIAAQDGEVRVRAPGVDVPLWHGDAEPRDVLLGIRPESLVHRATPGGMIRAVVGLVENLGNEEIGYLTTVDGEAPLAMRGPRPLALVPGATVGLDVTATDVHLFDATSGRRLLWQPHPELTPISV